mmetsp:Transcript_99425/g.252580  ORF Transcript_99425/g.252580 Transcript_99425/m.252580 type:complete len:234 (-) Transcript_99425:140-841(-)
MTSGNSETAARAALYTSARTSRPRPLMPSRCRERAGGTRIGATLKSRLQSPMTSPCNMEMVRCASTCPWFLGAEWSTVVSSRATIHFRAALAGGAPAAPRDAAEAEGRFQWPPSPASSSSKSSSSSNGEGPSPGSASAACSSFVGAKRRRSRSSAAISRAFCCTSMAWLVSMSPNCSGVRSLKRSSAKPTRCRRTASPSSRSAHVRCCCGGGCLSCGCSCHCLCFDCRGGGLS